MSITEEDLKVAAAKWILKNRGHLIPNFVMESIVSGARFLYETALSEIQQVVDEMEANITPDIITSVSRVLDGETQYTNVFGALETTYQQNSFIRDHFRFVVCLIQLSDTYRVFSLAYMYLRHVGQTSLLYIVQNFL